MEKKDISVIIPVYEEFENIKEKLSTAVESAMSMAPENKIILVGPEKSFGTYNEEGSGVICMKNDGPTDFCSQINLAASKCSTDYFSILEYDDQYFGKWFDNVELYSERHPDVMAYMPLNEIILSNKPEIGPVSYVNEPVWASSFSEELGFIDLECLKSFPEFNMTGAVIKTSDFISIGGLKPSIKVSFWYEFMLRACYNNKNLYVLPKVGYHHYLNRPGSLSEWYKTNTSTEEADWWMALAQQEYFFKKDRNKTYEE